MAADQLPAAVASDGPDGEKAPSYRTRRSCEPNRAGSGAPWSARGGPDEDHWPALTGAAPGSQDTAGAGTDGGGAA